MKLKRCVAMGAGSDLQSALVGDCVSDHVSNELRVTTHYN